jgi:hypothetical protein
MQDISGAIYTPGPLVAKGALAHHRGREHHGQGVGSVLARNVRRRAMDWLVDTGAVIADGSRGQHPQRSGQHGPRVGENVPEDVSRNDHVKGLWLPDELHRGVVYIHV